MTRQKGRGEWRLRSPLLVTSEQCGYVLRSIVEYYLCQSLGESTYSIQYKNSWLVVDGKMDVEQVGGY